MPDTIEPAAPRADVRRNLLRVAVLPAFLGLALLCWYLGARFVWFNVHEVIPGQVYRSSQPSPAFLAKTVREKNIHCVLKLNSPKESDWSRDESAGAGRAGVKFINVPMGVSRLPRHDELVALIDAIDAAPRPLLVHCKIGADRTGVASSLIVMHDGATFDEAVASQMNWRYLHFGHLGKAVEDIFPTYRSYCAANHLPTGGWAEFVDFARNHYDLPANPAMATNTH